jgi:hypothetical protein
MTDTNIEFTVSRPQIDKTFPATVFPKGGSDSLVALLDATIKKRSAGDYVREARYRVAFSGIVEVVNNIYKERGSVGIAIQTGSPLANSTEIEKSLADLIARRDNIIDSLLEKLIDATFRIVDLELKR